MATSESVRAEEIVIKSRQEASTTVETSDAAERGFLNNKILLVLDVCLFIAIFLYPLGAAAIALLLAADFGYFVWRRRATLRRYGEGRPRLVTPEDFAAVSEAHERAGIAEPTMTDWAAVAKRDVKDDWHADLRYRELVALYKSGSVADVGCGDGRLCWRYKICAPELYTGIDPGSGLISILADRTGFRAKAIVSTAENTCLESDSIDFVACSEAFEHLPDPSESLREFARIAKPGGRIVIQSPNAVRLRNLNPFHVVCCLLGHLFPSLVMRKVVHENTFVRAFTYHWDFTRRDIDTYMRGLPLRVETMHGATYRFNPEGDFLNRLFYRISRMPVIHWFGWDLTIVLLKQGVKQ
jgi:ubiquinone/menaquinone biosynthesis C-methylase UbiE